MQQIENIKHIQKSEPEQFQFLLRVGQKCSTTNLTNLMTGDPAIPLIGKYSRNQYHFLNVDVVVQMDLHYEDEQYKCLGNVIKLPVSVNDILNNIPEQIIHNKPPPKENKKGNKKQNKKKDNKKQQSITNFFKKVPQQGDIEEENQQQQIENPIEKQGEEEDYKEMQFHPLQFHKSQNIKFTWSVSSLANKKILEPLKQEPCLSYVNHNWVFEIINFEHQKKLIQHVPICVVDPIGIAEYSDPYKGLSFYQLRSEYMSVHLGPQGSLCFSPNNMKVMVDMKIPLVSFWTVILQDDGIHQVNYHWVILHEIFSEMSQNIAKEAKTLEQLLNLYGDLSPEFAAGCKFC